MSNPSFYILNDGEALARQLWNDLSGILKELLRTKEYVNLALSGGSTPSLLFSEIVADQKSVDWTKVRFFWVDERCVEPGDPESNYGVAKIEFLDPLQIPSENIFRVRGEDDPGNEADRYARLITEIVPPKIDIPAFDILLLGMGADGHTASIFPHEIDLWRSENLCTVGRHPETGQKRVSFTGKLINSADRVVFMVTGKSKRPVVNELLQNPGTVTKYPAALVKPVHGSLSWYLDKDAVGRANSSQ